MSLVYITHHNENIFDVDKKIDIQDRQGGHQYVSKFKECVRSQVTKPHIIDLGDGKKLVTSSKIEKHKTMGHAETPLDPPCAFLRKQHGIKWRRENEHVCPKDQRMPPVPKYVRPKTEAQQSASKEPFMTTNCPHRRYFKNHQHRANFIKVNVELVKKTPTKRPAVRYIDTPTGDRHDLLNTGLIPQYICSKKFGKVPCYLRVHQKMRKHCAAVAVQQDKCLAYVDHGLRQLTPEERHQILAGLKTNFADIFKVYQGLSLYIDTMAKRLRKGKLEKDLRQLEQDIYLMESNPVIFVSQY